MCHYVTGTLPFATAPATAKTVAESHHLQFEALCNPFVQKQLRQGEGYFRLGRGMCDCGTPLGSRDPRASAWRPSAKELARLHKKGWGEAKIARWLEQKKASQTLRVNRPGFFGDSVS
jgi:hypothetical protein